MKKHLFLISCLVLMVSASTILIFVGCSEESNDHEYILNDKWCLISYGGQSTQKVFNGNINISFHSDGTFEGTEYINHYYGKYKISGESIRMTLEFVETVYPENAEVFFTEYMSDISSYTLLSDNELRLNCKNGYCFVFHKAN